LTGFPTVAVENDVGEVKIFRKKPEASFNANITPRRLGEGEGAVRHVSVSIVSIFCVRTTAEDRSVTVRIHEGKYKALKATLLIRRSK
jgi:hypothetical protein